MEVLLLNGAMMCTLRSNRYVLSRAGVGRMRLGHGHPLPIRGFIYIDLINSHCMLLSALTYALSPTNLDHTPHITQHTKQANEAPLFVLMNHSPDPNGKQLPLCVFETETHTSTMGDKQQAVESFTQVPFQLNTTQSERISLDQVTKQGPSDGVSLLEVQNQSLVTSLKILSKKVDTLVKGLQEMEGGPDDKLDHNLLRKVNKICQQVRVGS